MIVISTIHLDIFGQTRDNPDFLGFYVESGVITRKEEKMMARNMRKGMSLKDATLYVFYKTRGYLDIKDALETKVLKKMA